MVLKTSQVDLPERVTGTAARSRSTVAVAAVAAVAAAAAAANRIFRVTRCDCFLGGRFRPKIVMV